jgi:hypothetical protein
MSPPPFIQAAENFAAARAGHPAFRLLKLYLRCDDDELAQVVKKIYCGAIPEETYRIPESRAKTAIGLALYPFHALLSKSWLWRRGETTDWQLETIDEAYFNRWFARIFAHLPGTKRLSPRAPDPVAGAETTTSPYVSVRLADLLALAVLAPLMALCLEHLRRAGGLDLRQAYRQAVTTFAVFSGYFSRFPCRRFITFDDESNPPARCLAFRRAGGAEFVVIQNGERNRHPHIAFGLMDRYLVFGPAYARVLQDIGTRARFEPVGALCLNERFAAVEEARRAGGEPRWDVLFVDQGIYPHNGLDERSGLSLETTVRRLGEIKARRPELRIAYQLRRYEPAQAWLEKKVREMVAREGQGRVELLDNPDGKASYRNLFKSRMLMTFESTLGFEALRLGRNTLFVNFSGDPAETICEDPRFQHEDPEADCARFEAKILARLAEGLAEAPAIAVERHLALDGGAQERIAERLVGAALTLFPSKSTMFNK